MTLFESYTQALRLDVSKADRERLCDEQRRAGRGQLCPQKPQWWGALASGHCRISTRIRMLRPPTGDRSRREGVRLREWIYSSARMMSSSVWHAPSPAHDSNEPRARQRNTWVGLLARDPNHRDGSQERERHPVRVGVLGRLHHAPVALRWRCRVVKTIRAVVVERTVAFA
jgi:hypothetical protein